MLVLTRKSNQSIMIGDDIEVSVLSIMGEKVRIGIQAPRDVPVFRKEVYLEIQQEQVGCSGPATRRWPSTRPWTSWSTAARRSSDLAEQVVQRLEHRDRHDHRGEDDREDEKAVAHRPALVDALAGAGRGAQVRRAGEALAPPAIEL